MFDGYQLQNNKKRIIEIRDLENDGFDFMLIYNDLKKTLPILTETKFDIKTRRYDIEFKKMFFVDKNFFKKNLEKNIIRFDIKKAYFSILKPFLSDKFLEKYKNTEKKHFLKAVGYSAYHKDVINNKTSQIDKERRTDRPDILKFCVEFLVYMNYFFRQIDVNFVWQYVDCFAFDYNIEKNNLIEATKQIYEFFIEKRGLQNYIKRPFEIDFHIEKNQIIKADYNQNYKAKKIYFEIEFLNIETGEIKTYNF